VGPGLLPVVFPGRLRPLLTAVIGAPIVYGMPNTRKRGVPVLGAPASVQAAPSSQTVPSVALDSNAGMQEVGNDIDSLLDEFGGGGGYNVNVFRKMISGPMAGRLAYVVKVPLSGFTLEDLQRDFGGGTFHLRIVSADDNKIRRQRVVTIEGEAKVPGAGPAVSVGAPSEIEAALKTLIELQTRSLTTPQPAPPAIDPMQMLTSVMGLVREMAPAPAAAQGASAKELLDMYFKGREDAERELPSGDGGNNIVNGLAQIGMPLVEIARENIALKKQELANAPARSAPAQQPEVQVPLWVMMFRPHVGALLQRARDGKNPGVYAAALAEDLPESAVAQVRTLVEDPDFPNQFCAMFPAFNESAGVRTWIEEFIKEAREMLSEYGDDDDVDGVAAEGGA